jgi:hypothetical protein
LPGTDFRNISREYVLPGARRLLIFFKLGRGLIGEVFKKPAEMGGVFKSQFIRDLFGRSIRVKE